MEEAFVEYTQVVQKDSENSNRSSLTTVVHQELDQQKLIQRSSGTKKNPEKDPNGLWKHSIEHRRAKCGTGLGLTITHKLARQMQGAVSVESVPEVGTVFSCRVDLPALIRLGSHNFKRRKHNKHLESVKFHCSWTFFTRGYIPNIGHSAADGVEEVSVEE